VTLCSHEIQVPDLSNIKPAKEFIKRGVLRLRSGAIVQLGISVVLQLFMPKRRIR
jgi:hypothetical protein